MLKADRIGWFVVLFLATLALAVFFSAIARAEAPTLAARIAALVPRYGSKSVELVDAQEFGTAVDIACNHDRECAARLLTMAVMESSLSAAVSRSEYNQHQGDAYKDKGGVTRYRAWGMYQIHKNAHNADVFGSPDLLVQSRVARSMQLGALAECKSEAGLWHMLAGRGCTGLWGGAEKRLALLARVRMAL